MSYLRNLSPYTYVDGVSDDYVFETGNKKDKGIEDYGSMSNKSIVELLIRFGNQYDSLIMVHMGIRLAENLKIKLRKKPLTDKQWFKLYVEMHKKSANKLGLNKKELAEMKLK